jgi:hypothetical protein
MNFNFTVFNKGRVGISIFFLIMNVLLWFKK